MERLQDEGCNELLYEEIAVGWTAHGAAKPAAVPGTKKASLTVRRIVRCLLEDAPQPIRVGFVKTPGEKIRPVDFLFPGLFEESAEEVGCHRAQTAHTRLGSEPNLTFT